MTDGRKTRGPLKQPRIGNLQQKILDLLSDHPNGMERSQLIAKTHNYILYGSSPWMVSVYAQSLYEAERIAESTQALFEGITHILNREERKEIDTLTRPDKPNWSDESSSHEYAHIQIEKIRELRAFAKILQTSVELNSDSLSLKLLHEAMLIQAEKTKRLQLEDSDNRFLAMSFLTTFGLADEKQRKHAEAALAKTYASLSRSLRLLREHGFIEKIVEHVPTVGGYSSHVKTTYKLANPDKAESDLVSEISR